MPTHTFTDPTPLRGKGVVLARRLLRVAWMSILLGLGVELLLVIIAAIFGAMTGAAPLIADAIQKVTWSVLVCSGIALGTAASKSARAATMGLLGLLSAP